MRLLDDLDFLAIVRLSLLVPAPDEERNHRDSDDGNATNDTTNDCTNVGLVVAGTIAIITAVLDTVRDDDSLVG